MSEQEENNTTIHAAPDNAKLYEALAKFQGKVISPKKTKTNPHLKNKYAPLDEVVESIRSAASPLGLGWTQHPCPRIIDGKVFINIKTTIFHASGQSISWESQYPVSQERNTNQAIVAATTYAKRNELSAGFGIAPDDDDDGEATTAKKPQAKSTPPSSRGKKKPPPRSEGAESRIDVSSLYHQYASYLFRALGIRGAAIGEYCIENLGASATSLTEAQKVTLVEMLAKKAQSDGVEVYTMEEYKKGESHE